MTLTFDNDSYPHSTTRVTATRYFGIQLDSQPTGSTSSHNAENTVFWCLRWLRSGYRISPADPQTVEETRGKKN